MNKISDPQYGDNFVGRGEEINELKEKIENNGIVVITGDRGIGKTNLTFVVEEAINEKKAGFLKKKICYHVNGSLFYEEMGKIFAPSKRITGVSSSVSTPIGGAGGGINWNPRESFILEFMEKSKEKIIFLENAHELKKVEFETIFEATRRNNRLRFILEIATPYKYDVQLRGGSYELVKLEELSNVDVEKIVIRECPNFSDAIVKRIISLSNGYPYVARSLAYICDRKNAEKEMFEFLESLRDDDMSYNLNKIRSQELIKKLAIAPATLTLKLIEAFCGEKVDTPLTDIKERGILVKLEEEEFYQIYHPLFREYLRDIQPIALQNKRELFCKTMKKVKSDFDSIYILLEVFNEPDIFKELIKRTENYAVINSIGMQAYTWGELEQALYAWNHLLERTKDKDKKCESIARGNIGKLYRIKGELDNALEYYGKALKLDEELGRKEGIANQLGNIGIVYQIKGELDKALEYYGNALKLDEELGRKEGIAANLGNIGIVYQIKGELDNALEYHEKALKLDEELGRKEGIAAGLGNMGNVYQIKGELDKALEYHEKALKLHEEFGRKEGMAADLGNIGTVYGIKGELDNALGYHEKALKLHEELGSKEGIAADLGNIGTVYKIKGELDNALGYHGKALKLNEELGSKEGIAADLGNIGTVYRIKGELDNALKYFEKALKLNEELGRKGGMAANLVNIGVVYGIKGELDNALGYYGKALKKFKDIGNRIETAGTLMNIGDIFVLKDDKERALDCYSEAKDLAKGSSVFEEINKRIINIRSK
jgi:tetratricopeptide (TPR) repeat protein